jgi:hypothetical protein
VWNLNGRIAAQPNQKSLPTTCAQAEYEVYTKEDSLVVNEMYNKQYKRDDW